MSKRTLLTALMLIVVLNISIPARAGHFDLSLFKSRHSADVYIDIDDFDAAVLIKSQGNRLVVPVDGKGNMTTIGDFELEETKRTYSEIGIGYKLGPITPFVGYSTRAIIFEERIVVKNEITGKNEITKKLDKETKSGIVLGVNIAQKIGNTGIEATIARASSGIYGEVKVKYYFYDYLALLGGGIYHPEINATGITLGFSVAY